MHLLGNIPLKDCISAGAGLNDEGVRHKYEVLKKAVENFTKSPYDTHDMIRYFGGFEMVAAIGAMLRAAELKMVVMIDGFIMSACALAASSLYPEMLEYCIFGHCGDENYHKHMLQLMNAEPLLSLGFRLGEGTGALCSYPIIQSAVNMINEMNNFDNANITRYF
jgi:nicotinate-nucleotide--dimethylbenzimidazole phosphoribosyltransferase